MSVATQLGLADLDSDLLGPARHRWPLWCEACPVLGVVEDVMDLPGWLHHAAPEDSDTVLLALARLASPSGGDDDVAARALAWVLLPGASLLAHRLRTLTHRIDEVVAAQLWVEARSFPWERGRKVAANILMNTRKGVLRDLDVGDPLRRGDPTWARAVVVSPDADLWGFLDARDPRPGPATAEAELEEVFEQAVRAGVVTASDCDLLRGLADAADRAGGGARRGQGGLTARDASETVAQQWGVSARTVRRRAGRALHALSDAFAPIGISARR